MCECESYSLLVFLLFAIIQCLVKIIHSYTFLIFGAIENSFFGRFPIWSWFRFRLAHNTDFIVNKWWNEKYGGYTHPRKKWTVAFSHRVFFGVDCRHKKRFFVVNSIIIFILVSISSSFICASLMSLKTPAKRVKANVSQTKKLVGKWNLSKKQHYRWDVSLQQNHRHSIFLLHVPFGEWNVRKKLIFILLHFPCVYGVWCLRSYV